MGIQMGGCLEASQDLGFARTVVSSATSVCPFHALFLLSICAIISNHFLLLVFLCENSGQCCQLAFVLIYLGTSPRFTLMGRAHPTNTHDIVPDE